MALVETEVLVVDNGVMRKVDMAETISFLKSKAFSRFGRIGHVG